VSNSQVELIIASTPPITLEMCFGTNSHKSTPDSNRNSTLEWAKLTPLRNKSKANSEKSALSANKRNNHLFATVWNNTQSKLNQIQDNEYFSGISRTQITEVLLFHLATLNPQISTTSVINILNKPPKNSIPSMKQSHFQQTYIPQIVQNLKRPVQNQKPYNKYYKIKI
jgi:hypothetical protein